MTKLARENTCIVSGVLIFIALLISGILYYNKPDFKPGDCLGQKYLEPWEHDDMIYKVLMVGKNEYHLTYAFTSLSLVIGHLAKGEFDPNPEEDQVINNRPIGFIDGQYKKVKCP